ncbi:unnamed protein product [Sphenostylis stenocarpa]|uniref:Uncharacterized protein n=1 Tax=Sphenostylis stenocarpa TaxID=92480 RepID=A0AA86VJX5_9FABA|nr:unnamed protein product [Sphenostylis stenocarpa]
MKTALLIPGMLAMLLLISLEVTANSKEEKVDRMGDAKLVGGGGLQGSGRDLPSPILPGRGSPNQGFSGQGYPNQGFSGQGYPNQGFNGQGYPNQGFNGQGYPNQGFNGQGIFPGRGYPDQGSSGGNYPGQGFPVPAQAPCHFGCCYGDARGCLSCCSSH